MHGNVLLQCLLLKHNLISNFILSIGKIIFLSEATVLIMQQIKFSLASKTHSYKNFECSLGFSLMVMKNYRNIHQVIDQLFWMNRILTKKLLHEKIKSARKNDDSQKVSSLSNFRIDDICLSYDNVKVVFHHS